MTSAKQTLHIIVPSVYGTGEVVGQEEHSTKPHPLHVSYFHNVCIMGLLYVQVIGALRAH